MAAGSGPETSQWEWAVMEPELSEREKALRDMFVNELLVDESRPVEAAMRCGFQAAFAKDYAQRFLNESYVQQRLEAVRHLKADPKTADEYDLADVRSSLRREMKNQFGTPAARVAAAVKLQEMIERDRERREAEKPNNGLRGGVLLVPMIASIDNWEEVAMRSQAKLVSDVRS